MFTWDESTPKTLSASSTNQLEVSRGVRAATCHELAFFTFFSPYFSQHLWSLSFKILSNQPHYTHFKSFRLLTQSTDNKKTRVLNPQRSWHNVYTTMGDLFQSKPKHKLYSIGVKPPAKPSTTTPPGSENLPYRSSRSLPRRHPLACLLELEVPNDTRADH